MSFPHNRWRIFNLNRMNALLKTVSASQSRSEPLSVQASRACSVLTACLGLAVNRMPLGQVSMGSLPLGQVLSGILHSLPGQETCMLS